MFDFKDEVSSVLKYILKNLNLSSSQMFCPLIGLKLCHSVLVTS